MTEHLVSGRARAMAAQLLELAAADPEDGADELAALLQEMRDRVRAMKADLGETQAHRVLLEEEIRAMRVEWTEVRRVLAEAREVIADAIDGVRNPVWAKAAMATLDHIDTLRVA